MFPYEDPTVSDFLNSIGALDLYRYRLHAQYEMFAVPETKFVPIRAFGPLQTPPRVDPSPSKLDRPISLLPGTKIDEDPDPVAWFVFPKMKGGNADTKIDSDRTLQEEYTEWVVSKRDNVGLTSITFTTHFSSYYETLADVSFEALVAGVRSMYHKQDAPTMAELLGTSQPPALPVVDGIVGDDTWRLLEPLPNAASTPTLQRGSQNDAVKLLQTRLTWLNLFKGQITGLFDQTTENAVKELQKRYKGYGQKFRENLPNNPWNNGQKGILCMVQKDNTMEALFRLLSACGVPSTLGAQDVCGSVGGKCVPGRNSDPKACQAVQTIAKNKCVFSPVDPVRIEILELQGIWKLDGKEIDINDFQQNQGVWRVTDNGQQAILYNLPGLTLDGKPIVSGAQVSRSLSVGLKVFIAPDAAVKR